jgi:hypothetical protein
MSLALDELSDLTGFTHLAERLAAHFAETIVAVARSGNLDPLSIAQSARAVLARTMALRKTLLADS